jgi:putative ATP-dependent endonuclease of OLD family
MLSIHEDDDPELKLHVCYEWDEKEERVKFPTLWGGENEGQAVPGEVLQLIYHVHLDALRDAARFIAPGRGSRIGELIRKLEPNEVTRVAMEKEVLTALRDLHNWTDLRNNAEKIINKHLNQVTFDRCVQEVKVDFVESTFRRIAENLRLHLPRKAKPAGEVVKQEVDSPHPFKIWQNGLGYNNLIYAATIFGDLVKRAESEKAIHLSLLIEEPEAHLHPQLQRLFFRYLESFGKEGIQVFVTSHSPTICSQADFDRINVLTHGSELPTNRALASMPLSRESKHKLQRFLDVTKSQL